MNKEQIEAEHIRLCNELAMERAFAMEQTPEVTALETQLQALRAAYYDWDGVWWVYRKSQETTP